MLLHIKLPIAVFLVVFLSVSLCGVCAFSDSLGNLIKVGKSQAQMEKALAKETKSYKAVKKAVESGTIKVGDEANSIKKRFGSPLVIIPQKDNSEKWVYKPGYATHFDNIKIYLFFDSNNRLSGIKTLNQKE
ncbi:MAG: hypothetical protein ISS92_02465 [Candidatus Omnitrophica bacterium]|nr:hypothetical protein [Candidatus Omnitrophota bacterium]